MVVTHLQLLSRRYRGTLDTTADEYIDVAVGGARRMYALIDDLLKYSRIGREKSSPEKIDLNSLLDAVKTDLQLLLAENEAVVTSGPLPTVVGVRSQIYQLLENLVANAIKYRKEAPPVVEMSAKRRSGEWLISIRDNGIGIERKYFERIFVIFERLQPQSKHSGTGLGLALCKRIVTRHGGTIWLDSTPGQGSTFFFTLPDEIPKT